MSPEGTPVPKHNTTWRLLDTGARSAAENIALDQALLLALNRGISPNTLRFLRFAPPAVLVGCHQCVEEEVRLSFCRENGIDVGRRITGGGAIFCDRTQLGWEIIAKKDDPRVPRVVEDIYRRMCQGAVNGLELLGIPAAFRPRNDIEVRGRKISGTGGTDLGGAILFQGTLLMDFDVATMLRTLRIPVEKLKDKEVASVRERVTCVREQLGRLPPHRDVVSAFREGFADALGVSFVDGALLPEEETLAQELLPVVGGDDYVYGLRPGASSRAEMRSICKTPGGLIRATLVIDGQRRRIKSVLITGDFFAFPRRAIFDLEALLKDAPADRDAVAQIVERFFARARPVIPGIGPDDLCKSIDEALRKMEYPAYGIPPEQVNSVFTVVQPFDAVPEPTALLLPYCAKLPDCALRYEEGCSECGLCSIGEAFTLARQHGLKPITIQNYEHLEETLRDCVRQGIKGFVGCCCEAFLAKHREDFERIGLPGILVDLNDTTCYDLGREEDAHHGRFDRLTQVKLDLLEKVIESVKNGLVKL